MFLTHTFSRAVLRKYFWTSALTVVVVPALMLAGTAAWAKDKNESSVELLTTIPIPPTTANVGKNLYSYDIS